LTEATSPDGGALAAQRAFNLEYISLGWVTLETIVALISGIHAASIALTAFGLDSGIELVSATITVVRLRALLRADKPDEAKERLALRAVAVSFYILAAYVTVDATISLVRANDSSTSPSGIAIAAAALIVMPALSITKRRAATQLEGNSRPGAAALVRADAAETMLCAILSVTTLLGVGLNATLGWWWADPVASLAIVFFAIKEGRESWQANSAVTNDCHH
jgi:divalent metal cation (Fe/Co/Zn/Cd) transporter